MKDGKSCDVLEKCLGKQVILSYLRKTKRGLNDVMYVERTDGILKREKDNYFVSDGQFRLVQVIPQEKSFITIEGNRYDLLELMKCHTS